MEKENKESVSKTALHCSRSKTYCFCINRLSNIKVCLLRYLQRFVSSIGNIEKATYILKSVIANKSPFHLLFGMIIWDEYFRCYKFMILEIGHDLELTKDHDILKF